MLGLERFLVWKLLLALAVLLLLADSAMAYVGPGAGLELVGYFLSLVGLVGVAFSTMVMWPIYALIRRIRRGKQPAPPPPVPPPAETPPAQAGADAAGHVEQ